MKRLEVIQKIINAKNARTYLEIGVSSGNVFLRIKARHKIAVDPNFRISKRKKLKWMIKNGYNISAKFHETTSDDFFENEPPVNGLDVAFVDGLHTYEQALKDVNNALDHMNEHGVVIMHDCNPPHEAAAYPATSREDAASLNLPGWTEEWSGDVWKAVCHLRSFRKDLDVFVLDCDVGLGIVTFGQPEDHLNFNEQELKQLTYNDLAKNKKNWLNLKPAAYLNEFLTSIS